MASVCTYNNIENESDYGYITTDIYTLYRHSMCFRFIHFILISTAHALLLTCLIQCIYICCNIAVITLILNIIVGTDRCHNNTEKQIPNILIILPILSFSAYHCPWLNFLLPFIDNQSLLETRLQRDICKRC
jgi:hypothetical protein